MWYVCMCVCICIDLETDMYIVPVSSIQFLSMIKGGTCDISFCFQSPQKILVNRWLKHIIKTKQANKIILSVSFWSNSLLMDRLTYWMVSLLVVIMVWNAVNSLSEKHNCLFVNIYQNILEAMALEASGFLRCIGLLAVSSDPEFRCCPI